MSVLVLILGVINVAVIAYLLRYSGRVQCSETRIIDASPAQVYVQVADFRQWKNWSPWLEHQPDAALMLSTPSDAVGASYAWRGSKIGAGAVKHLELVPHERIEQLLTGSEPFEYQVRAVWTFAEHDGKTKLTLQLKGRMPLAKRLYARTVQGMLGLDFRYSINKLAALLNPADAGRYVVEYLGRRTVPGLHYAHGTYSGAITGVASAVPRGLAEVKQKLSDLGVAPAGPALCLYARTNVKARATVCHMGYPLSAEDATRYGSALPIRHLPTQDAYVVLLRGPRSALEVAWYQATLRMRAEGFAMSQTTPPFERYLDDGSVAEHEQLTELYIPITAAATPDSALVGAAAASAVD